MNILLVDDDLDSRACIGDFLRELGHAVDECDDGREALNRYYQGNYAMVLSDIRMPLLSGLELLQTIMAQPYGQDTAVVLFTGHGDVDSAVSALRAGASDYLLKPINVDQLATITERIAARQLWTSQPRRISAIPPVEVKEAIVTEPGRTRVVVHSTSLSGIGIFSDSMRSIVQSALKFHTDRTIPVLIEGETGTGKEVIAKLIHFGSIEETAPFIDINCAALTPTLFESELFGYEAGAFTGGLTKGQRGKLDLAQGGTLFLDEVGELALELQGKLLRVIQEKEYYRVGGLKKVSTNVRIICATNQDLEKSVAEGRFRKDLFYRLRVGHVQLPPLRRRPDDIVPLAGMFLRAAAKQKQKRFKRISTEAAMILLDYPWPGNVRELRNTMEWVVFMFDEEELLPVHLTLLQASRPQSLQSGDPACPSLDPYQFSLPEKGFELEDFVDRIVSEALQMHRGNKTETARYLGISRRSLYCRLERMQSRFKGISSADCWD
ncbi:response regulator [Heliobacterium gestii]|uniref:Stage 0 sporulation protein A homolog n=1 Tax=Heliomicrobium gestii TaxID=2699 RepID=A0A845L9Y0_HELGE|nr:sigma-54 dependent transcriptional regulator [Heliomicrobium gestii]MBM7865853.1 DNA-binding NtrC family response regulator [Heliomicrobium gestii]MZP42094.1 response regulator [Heliomicrobium gestii]